MIAIQGTIEKIETENNNGKDKKVIIFQMGANNTVFVEFQGNMMNSLKDFSEGQKAEIRIRFNGKISKLGRKYNNIVAKSIKKI